MAAGKPKAQYGALGMITANKRDARVVNEMPITKRKKMRCRLDEGIGETYR